MNAFILLLTLTTATLVLRSGERISVEGAMREDRGVVTFRSGGVLYSLPAREIDRVITPAEGSVSRDATPSDTPPEVRRLRVSEEDRKRLIAEIEQNRAGGSTPRQINFDELPPEPSPRESAEEKRAEWEWRREARAYEESVRRAVEELELLETQAEQIQSKIHTLLVLGYKPHHFTYDSTRLARTLEQIPYARLEVERARRAYEQFREDARRQGVLPGWLR